MSSIGQTGSNNRVDWSLVRRTAGICALVGTIIAFSATALKSSHYTLVSLSNQDPLSPLRVNLLTNQKSPKKEQKMTVHMGGRTKSVSSGFTEENISQEIVRMRELHKLGNDKDVERIGRNLSNRASHAMTSAQYCERGRIFLDMVQKYFEAGKRSDALRVAGIESDPEIRGFLHGYIQDPSLRKFVNDLELVANLAERQEHTMARDLYLSTIKSAHSSSPAAKCYIHWRFKYSEGVSALVEAE